MRYLALAFVCASLACSSGATSTPAAFCATDPRAETFSLGMQAKGVAGSTIAITNATPSVVQQGLNDWTITIHDSNGNPIDGTVTVLSSMPDHNHNSPTPPTITSNGNGTYDIGAINLSMGGIWTIEISVTSSTVTDSATFTFCVDGAS